MSTSSQESALLRRTRLRLMAWSGGSTLVILMILGAAIYAAASTRLAQSGVAELQQRLEKMTVTSALVAGASTRGPVSVVSDPGLPGVQLGGGTSGTIGFMISTAIPADAGTAGYLPPMPGLAAPLVDPATLAATSGHQVVVDTTIQDAPIRVLAEQVPSPNGDQTVAIVIGDRSAEIDTLRTLLVVLLAGGFLVLVASLLLGYLYAGRALVPIRDSLRRQREFAADASHELRTPLTITRAAIAELRRGRSDPATVDRALEDLDAGATRIERLVDDLLLLARTDADSVELVVVDADLGQVAAETAEAFEAVAGQRDVRLALDVVPAPIRGDEGRLRQLVGILLDNAVRHSPAGGRVVVAVREGRLVVEDEGPGVAAEDRAHVFDRFWRAPGAPAGGTGLGLAIARWIAERHHGSIRVESRAGGAAGARFVVELPGA